MTGPLRAKVMERTINHVFPRLERPILPGFNFFVHREAFLEAGGFPEVPNEDTAFSRALGRQLPTGYHDSVLVESSGRRIADSGLTGTLVHYVSLDAGRPPGVGVIRIAVPIYRCNRRPSRGCAGTDV